MSVVSQGRDHRPARQSSRVSAGDLDAYAQAQARIQMDASAMNLLSGQYMQNTKLGPVPPLSASLPSFKQPGAGGGSHFDAPLSSPRAREDRRPVRRYESLSVDNSARSHDDSACDEAPDAGYDAPRMAPLHDDKPRAGFRPIAVSPAMWSSTGGGDDGVGAPPRPRCVQSAGPSSTQVVRPLAVRPGPFARGFKPTSHSHEDQGPRPRLSSAPMFSEQSREEWNVPFSRHRDADDDDKPSLHGQERQQTRNLVVAGFSRVEERVLYKQEDAEGSV